MSYADVVFKETCKEILEHGTDTQGQEVRPHWEDGTPAYTIKKFGVVNRYDLRKEFPAITLRRIALKSAMDEILWIYQKKSNNIHDLKSHIWDQWADEEGSIGTVYGWQIGEKFEFKGDEIDQMDYVLKQLKETPFSRRIMTNMYQFKNLHTGHLDPCAYSMTYNVTDEHREDGKLTLNAILNQRSQDMLAANGWNTMQYAALLCMFAQVAGLKPGTLTHNIGDCHIYDRHIPLVKKLLEAEPVDCSPKLIIKNPTRNFYDFKVEDFEIQGYDYNHSVKLGKIPVAE